MISPPFDDLSFSLSFKSNAISYFSIFSHLRSRDISCLQPNQCTSFSSIFLSHIFNIYHLTAEKVKNAPIIEKIKRFFQNFRPSHETAHHEIYKNLYFR